MSDAHQPEPGAPLAAVGRYATPAEADAVVAHLRSAGIPALAEGNAGVPPDEVALPSGGDVLVLVHEQDLAVATQLVAPLPEGDQPG